MCLAVTCHLHFWQNDWDFFVLLCDTEIRVSKEGGPRRKQISHHPWQDSNTRPLNHQSSALTTELSLLPVTMFAFSNGSGADSWVSF